MDRKEHWERVYQSNPAETFSWFQAMPAVSVRLLESAGLTPST